MKLGPENEALARLEDGRVEVDHAEVDVAHDWDIQIKADDLIGGGKRPRDVIGKPWRRWVVAMVRIS